MNDEILEDVKSIAILLNKSPGDKYSRDEYLQHPKHVFSYYQIYDNGMTWNTYVEAAGYVSKAKEEKEDDYYFNNLKKAYEKLGRLPLTTERKMYGLNFSKRRWSTLSNFIEDAIAKGVLPYIEMPKDVIEEYIKELPEKIENIEKSSDKTIRPIPPIPENAKRSKWERTKIEGFPYAPQDESGVVALFAILCAMNYFPWQIIQMNSAKGIDAIIWDDEHSRELIVELKYLLSKASWNHNIDEIDFVVCWENRWIDFQKPVVELKKLISSGNISLTKAST